MCPLFIMLVGLPGSGKSTYANTFRSQLLSEINDERVVIISSDAIRKELYGDESIQTDPARVFSLMEERTLDELDKGSVVLYDATNINRKNRSNILSKIPPYASKWCIITWAPVEECIRRDSLRSRSVGKFVIDKMVRQFEAPYYDEGFEVINVMYPEGFDSNSFFETVIENTKIEHDNPHHSLSIYEHMQASEKNMRMISSKEELCLAASYHDIGKPYVKSFKNKKEEETATAHYYNHENVGAYLSYGLLLNVYIEDDSDKNRTLYIPWLIGSHMGPFSNNKYYKNLPTYLKNDIDMLHRADLEAH